MRLRQLYEDGRIVKGVNTTSDVGPNEISKQAKKFGNTVDKDGRPPTLSKKVKGPKTNVAFNLGLTEAQEIGSSTEIYVDMDGVLADFFTEWGKLMKVDNWWNISDKHNIDDALQKIRDTDNFWLDLPLTKNAKNLLNLIKQVKGSYIILSSPLPGDKNSEPHKREWIEKNLSFFPPKQILIRHDKETFATQQDGTPNILIDDYGVNVRKWEANGGVGFKHKDHKFERTAKAIKQHINQPVQTEAVPSVAPPPPQLRPKNFDQIVARYKTKKPSALAELIKKFAPNILIMIAAAIGLAHLSFLQKFLVRQGIKFSQKQMQQAMAQVESIKENFAESLDKSLTARIAELVRDSMGGASAVLGQDDEVLRTPQTKQRMVAAQQELNKIIQSANSQDKIKIKNIIKDVKSMIEENFADGKKTEGSEITMWTNPLYQGADVDDKYYEKQPVKIVDVSKLTPFEPADKMDPKDNHDNMMRFVDKIMAGDKIKPIVIVPHEGKWLIVDGHHRYFAHIKAGVDKIRAVIADPKDLTWRDDVPDSIEENFADGKKKGKSRPGRVKRAGASCDGSVTSLRKKAKNASGEKAKMYHWCANMKAGRQK